MADKDHQPGIETEDTKYPMKQGQNAETEEESTESSQSKKESSEPETLIRNNAEIPVEIEGLLHCRTGIMEAGPSCHLEEPVPADSSDAYLFRLKETTVELGVEFSRLLVEFMFLLSLKELMARKFDSFKNQIFLCSLKQCPEVEYTLITLLNDVDNVAMYGIKKLGMIEGRFFNGDRKVDEMILGFFRGITHLQSIMSYFVKKSSRHASSEKQMGLEFCIRRWEHGMHDMRKKMKELMRMTSFSPLASRKYDICCCEVYPRILENWKMVSKSLDRLLLEKKQLDSITETEGNSFFVEPTGDEIGGADMDGEGSRMRILKEMKDMAVGLGIGLSLLLVEYMFLLYGNQEMQERFLLRFSLLISKLSVKLNPMVVGGIIFLVDMVTGYTRQLQELEGVKITDSVKPLKKSTFSEMARMFEKGIYDLGDLFTQLGEESSEELGRLVAICEEEQWELRLKIKDFRKGCSISASGWEIYITGLEKMKAEIAGIWNTAFVVS